MKEPWQPNADLETLQFRAKIISQLRQFFIQRNFLEVETPILGASAATDPHLQSIRTAENYYLQTSPEFHMKRLLSAGVEHIFQITKAFRQGESGRHHNPEFTILEWYHLGYDHFELMDEMDALLVEILELPPAKRCTYREIFQKNLNLDPFKATESQLKNCASRYGINLLEEESLADRDMWLDLLMSHGIQPKLGFEQPVYVYDFPASQAALAKVTLKDGLEFAERFEVYLGGMEIANGYHELTDAAELRRRFERDVLTRQQYDLPVIPIDSKLIAAHEVGFPDCAGIALGLDRLIMFALNKSSIADVMSFSVDNA